MLEFRKSAVVLALLLLTACNDETIVLDSGTPPPINQTPLASFNMSSVNGFVGQDIFVDASGSSDADDDILSYAWLVLSKPSGSTAVFSDLQAKSTSATLDTAGNYLFQLTVSDGEAVSSIIKSVSTVSTTPPANHNTYTVVANAGLNQHVDIGNLVILDGHESADKNGAQLTYAWSLTSIPAGSTATLSANTNVFPVFTPDVAGLYQANLVVTNVNGVSSPAASVMVAVSDPSIGVVTNTPPIANAGADISTTLTNAGINIGLDGSQSHDVDGDVLSYIWTIHSKPVGSAASLSNDHSATPALNADLAGDYDITLVSSDGQSYSLPDSVQINLVAQALPVNNRPVANAGPNLKAISVSQAATLDGSASNDKDGDSLTYRWTIVNKPSTSLVTLTASTSVSPGLIPDVPGDYTMALIVNDGQVDSIPSSVVVSVDTPYTNHTPSVTLTNDVQPTSEVNDTITFTAAVADLDIADTHTYQWSFISKPLGSKATLTSTSATADLVPDQQGDYTLQVIATDNNGAIALDASIISITHIPNVLAVPSNHQLIVNSSLGGDDQAGALYSVTKDAIANGEVINIGVNGATNASPLFEMKGYSSIGRNLHQSFIYNPTTKLFYSQLDKTGVYLDGTLISFDPLTDKVDVITHIDSNKYVEGNHVSDFVERLALHPSGKYLIGSSRYGGKHNAGRVYIVDIEMTQDSNGDLVKTERFGDLNWIYDIGCGNGDITRIDATGSDCSNATELVGKEVFSANIWEGDALEMYTLGNFDNTKRPSEPTMASDAGLFQIIPTDTSNLTKPWKYQVASADTYDTVFVESPARQYAKANGYYMSTLGQLGGNSGTFFSSGGGGTVNFDCAEALGVIWDSHNATFVSFCTSAAGKERGLFVGQSSPAISKIRGYSGWGEEEGVAMTLSNTLGLLVSTEDSLAMFVADALRIDGITLPLAYSPSRVVSINIRTGAEKTIIQGSKTNVNGVGSVFMGAAQTDNTDKYVVTLSYDGGDKREGSIVKYDRDTGLTTSVTLGFDTFAYNYGQPLKHSNGKIYTAAVHSSDARHNRGSHLEYDATDGKLKELTGNASVQPGLNLIETSNGDIYGYGADFNQSTKPNVLYKLDKDSGLLASLAQTANGSGNVTAQVLASGEVNGDMLAYTSFDTEQSNIYCFDSAQPVSGANPVFASIGFGIIKGSLPNTQDNKPHDVLRGLTYSESRGKWFFIAKQNGGALNIPNYQPTIQQMDDCSTQTITHAADLNYQPTTMLLEMSATNLTFTGQPMFFGMGAKLGQFDGTTVIEIDLVNFPGTANGFDVLEIQGYLTELSSGELVGVLEATNSTTRDIEHYTFSYDGTSFEYSKLPMDMSLDVHYPGIFELR